MLVLLLAMAVAAADQASKQVVRYTFDLGESRPVVDGFFSLTYVNNSGAAWGMLRDHGTALIVLSVVMLVLMVVFRRSFLTDTWEHRLALGCMIGGVVGNLMDRLRLGAVTDFLDVHWRGRHWPTFNIADAAICVGVGLYVLSSLWVREHPLKDRPAGGS